MFRTGDLELPQARLVSRVLAPPGAHADINAARTAGLGLGRRAMYEVAAESRRISCVHKESHHLTTLNL